MAAPTAMTVLAIRAIVTALNRDDIAEYFRQEGDNEERAPFEVCGGVSVDTFSQYIGDGEGLAIGLRFLELSPDGRILIVDLPTLAHEATAREFESEFLFACGNHHAIAMRGPTTVHRDGLPAKEADATYGPLSCGYAGITYILLIKVSLSV